MEEILPKPHSFRCSLRLAGKAGHRLRGLLATEPDDEALLLMPCKDVHTFGMRHDLDIAFVSSEGMILATHRNVGPQRRLAHPWAEAVIERFASPEDPWFTVGDRLHIRS
ncbi:DUF192 domain-containing protein [Eggerthellaceae bacterium zg-887]|uniref:DUF192 domain-containing protein n=1 Tax=Xiamenia xianingshaonis TaxID=2682776 RepID=UPI00140DB571|nr:DUF192 domain-containing protein [Xiamenia xianingshaonis]NHM15852.1 DUF192 domain-containing protein [Xiamenia xianingshaonis]